MVHQNRETDNFCSKIHYKLRRNLNLPSDLNEKYTAKCHIISENLYHIITFQFNDCSLASEKSPF